MKKISTNTVKEFLKENETAREITRSFHVGESDVEYTVKTELTIEEKSLFISRVLSGCFDALGNYRPEYEAPMLRATILQMCTNLPVISMRGQTGDNGESLMDMEAMNRLYLTLGLESIEDSRYQSMKGEICTLCRMALDWHRNRRLRQENGTVSEAAASVRAAAEKFISAVENTDIASLIEFAGELTKYTKGADSEGLADALSRMWSQAGDSHADDQTGA